MKSLAFAVWWLGLTALNALTWKVVRCDWSHPYSDDLK